MRRPAMAGKFPANFIYNGLHVWKLNWFQGIAHFCVVRYCRIGYNTYIRMSFSPIGTSLLRGEVMCTVSTIDISGRSIRVADIKQNAVHMDV